MDLELSDETERARTIGDLVAADRLDEAARLLPPERPYPVPDAPRATLGLPGSAGGASS